MQPTLLKSRVAAGQSAFIASTGNVSRHARRSHRAQQRMATVSVASIEEPQTAGIDSGMDKDQAYKTFEALLDEYSVSFATGDKVTGTVFRVDQKGAYVDVGGKSTAFCPTNELSMANIARATEVVGPDTVREFAVIRGEGAGSSELTLSLKRLEMGVAWQRLRQVMEEDASVKATVAGVNRGGLLIDIENIRGFCPGSQLARRVATFEELLGKEMDFKVTEVDEEKGRLMVSNKRAGAAEAAAAFKVGDVVTGSVMSVKPYGAFIDLGGGASGLLHISQISHDRILNVEKVLADGDKIKVMVLSQDKERGRVALCTKKLEPTPGDMLRDPALVYEKAEEMAALFKERVAAAEAAAREGAAAAAAAASAGAQAAE
ncbi:hypothetical protein Ndes2526B_g04187 [Nannochloris sp. 'desiccata']